MICEPVRDKHPRHVCSAHSLRGETSYQNGVLHVRRSAAQGAHLFLTGAYRSTAEGRAVNQRSMNMARVIHDN